MNSQTQGARRLASAVILLALRDASKGDRAAKTWLRSSYCQHLLLLLDIDPAALQTVDPETVTVPTLHSARA